MWMERQWQGREPQGGKNVLENVEKVKSGKCPRKKQQISTFFEKSTFSSNMIQGEWQQKQRFPINTT